MNTSSRPLYTPRIPRAFASPGRSPLASGLKKISSSRYSQSGRSTQSAQVVCKTPYHVVEGFGQPLPMPVTEALTFSDRSVAVSVSLGASGWAWAVCGRRLLIWSYRSVTQRTQCYELTLPPSEFAHKAELVCVFCSEGSTVPSCMAVSPEGAVRYWPSAQHESPAAAADAGPQLQGQECHALCWASGRALLATTTSSLLLVAPAVGPGGRHALTVRPLRAPAGWLGLGLGLSRRVSSLLFGAMPAGAASETKLVKVVAVPGSSGGQWWVLVLSELTLQQWELSADACERLVWEADANRMVREAFHDTVWEACAGTPGELDVWLLDMQPTDGGVMLLAAAAHPQLSPHLHYALGKLLTESEDPPSRFSVFCPLKKKGLHSPVDVVPEVQPFQFLCVGPSAYLYNKKTVLALPALGDEADTIDFLGSDDRLLGASLCGNVPVFFSKVHGLVSISPADISPHDLLNSSMSVTEGPSLSDATLSQVSEAGLHISVSEATLRSYTEHPDAATRLKAAFINFYKNGRDPTVSRHILDEVLPEGGGEREVGGLLDTVVVRLSVQLIDDVPVSDPRWAERKEGCMGYASLQITHQLQDKSRALDLYVTFLNALKLWHRLGAIMGPTGAMPTAWVLGEHAEKLVAAATLHKLQAEHAELIEMAIQAVVQRREEAPSGGLSMQDLFYREVSNVHQFFHELVTLAEDAANSERSPQNVATFLQEVNDIVMGVLREVVQYRQLKADQFSPVGSLNPEICVYMPWTAMSGNSGIKDALVKLGELTLAAARTVGQGPARQGLLDGVVSLLDVGLDGRKGHVESLRGGALFDKALVQYERQRREAIGPLLEEGEYERAAILAEKYCDFDILITICEKTNNQERLDMYMDKFAEQGFCKFAFGRLVQERQHGALLELCLRRANAAVGGARADEEARQLLATLPALSWLYDAMRGRFRASADTLHRLADKETELLQRKKNMVALSKLALLASGEPPAALRNELAALDTAANLVVMHEHLPTGPLVHFGYDTTRLPVLAPQDMIKLLICDENLSADEEEFKKAYDLLQFVDDELEQNELRHSIWCQAIRRDKWDDVAMMAPTDAVQKMVFFKTVEMLLFYGASPDEVLPPLDRLLESPELSELSQSNNFKYLLRVGYEYIERTARETQA